MPLFQTINYAAITTLRAGVIASGNYVTTVSGSTSTGSFSTLGQVFYAPVDVPATQTFTGLATDVSATASGGTSPLIHLGLYADDGTGTKPTGACLANTEVTFDPTSGTGDKYVAWGAAQTLGAGRYWIAWMLTSGTALGGAATIVTLNPSQNIGLDVLTNVSHRGWGQSAASNASTLPTVSGLSYTGGNWPIMGMKAQ